MAEVTIRRTKLDVPAIVHEFRGELEAARRDAIVRGNMAVATNDAASLAELALEQQRPADFRAAMALVGPRSPDPWVVYRVGRAWARSGNVAEVDSAIRALDSLSIGPSPQYDALKSLLRAEIALATAQPEKAVSEAEAAVRFEASTVAYETLARADLAAKRPADGGDGVRAGRAARPRAVRVVRHARMLSRGRSDVLAGPSQG